MIEILLIVICALILVNIALTYRARPGTGEEYLQPLLNSLASIEKGLPRIEDTLRNEMSRNRDETNRNSMDTRGELANSLSALTGNNETKLTRLTETLYGKFDSFQQMMESNAKGNRDELTKALKAFQDQLQSSVSGLLLNTEQRLDKMRDVLEARLASIQNDNNEKIERMRQTVDEKLHKTLEDRLGQSFQIVSDRLELVQKGLGEMHNLAIGVGDLKKVLTNVKTRGSLGEYRLEMILEQILSPEQYQKNAATKPGSRENVEFAVKLPSKDAETGTILLPVDSKFPQDRYQALIDAYEKGDLDSIKTATTELENTIKSMAKDIRDKYLNPPLTTDFAIMFLPFEGLYAEVVKRPALFETLQGKFKVTVAGPSTFAAILNSLQMGFRTLAIQKRSSEVWTLLGAVKTEFGKFGAVLEGIQKNLDAAHNKMHAVNQKTRSIERKLKEVETLPQKEVVKYLGDASEIEPDDEDQTQQPENAE